jgi:hypothetical protein
MCHSFLVGSTLAGVSIARNRIPTAAGLGTAHLSQLKMVKVDKGTVHRTRHTLVSRTYLDLVSHLPLFLSSAFPLLFPCDFKADVVDSARSRSASTLETLILSTKAISYTK